MKISFLILCLCGDLGSYCSINKTYGSLFSVYDDFLLEKYSFFKWYFLKHEAYYFLYFMCKRILVSAKGVQCEKKGGKTKMKLYHTKFLSRLIFSKLSQFYLFKSLAIASSYTHFSLWTFEN